MEFRIADTFTDSLARLTGDEQKAVKTTAFDLQMNPASPGLQFHKLDKAKDKNFWSVRVSSDIRLIIHKTQNSLLLCYVDHHDKAYDWAERRKLETHPKTGAAQLVEIRETVKEIFVPIYIEEEVKRPAKPKPLLFAHLKDEDLLGYGVPPEWLKDVREANEDTLLALADHLPAEASEALLEVATGGKPVVPQPVPVDVDPFEHPDAQRRFRTMANVDELERAFAFPWDKWMIFLHPDQQHLVDRDYNGPARVTGSAGTGKTIVALHRAVHLAREHTDSRVLLATFTDALANALDTRMKRLVRSEPRLADRIEVRSLHALAERLYKARISTPTVASVAQVADAIHTAAKEVEGHKFSQSFLIAEWEQVVDAWQLPTWEDYREVPRLGRKTRLPEAQRALLWSIYTKVRASLAAQGLITTSQLFTELAAHLRKGGPMPYDFAVVDEAQDLSVAQLRFFAALGSERPNALFFAGDIGQRIFQQAFSWRAIGVDIRGRSRTLRVNYRTSHQIRQQADKLLAPELTDADGNAEERSDTVSIFNGPPPSIEAYQSEAEEQSATAKHIQGLVKSGVQPHEIGVIVRSAEQLDRAKGAVKASGLPFRILDERVEPVEGEVSVSTMHLAKGLEFRAVIVMACDDEVIPLQERIDSVGDESDLKEIYDTERHLLYVACTRAREQLLVSCVEPGSEFLDDLGY
jgi:mRNA-degrading endonuclease RelE of RelBE toxin-antitoxin system